MWFLAYKSPFLQGTYTFLRFSDLLTPIGVTNFNLGPGTVFSYNDLWMILFQLTVNQKEPFKGLKLHYELFLDG